MEQIYILVGLHSEIVYKEGTEPEIHQYLNKKYPNYDGKKKESLSGQSRVLHEPMKIRKVDSFFERLK